MAVGDEAWQRQRPLVLVCCAEHHTEFHAPELMAAAAAVDAPLQLDPADIATARCHLRGTGLTDADVAAVARRCALLIYVVEVWATAATLDDCLSALHHYPPEAMVRRAALSLTIHKSASFRLTSRPRPVGRHLT